MLKKIQKFWWFTFKNPKVRQGEAGGFKWCFRRLTLIVSTMSGNFKARFTAAEHPFGYLVSSKDDSQIQGYCQMLYTIAMLITTDQGFVNDLSRAIQKYDKRLQKANPIVEDETEEKIAMEEVKQVQEYVEKPENERRKLDREVNGRFKKAVKNLEKSE